MSQALELRFAFVLDDYESAVHLYRDVLGLEAIDEYVEERGRGMILRVPRATLELFDSGYADLVDEIEVGDHLGERVRIAVRVADLERAVCDVVEAGAEPLASVVETPWGDRNRRLRTADDVQLTLFESRRPPT